jgi:hypothetical protein
MSEKEEKKEEAGKSKGKKGGGIGSKLILVFLLFAAIVLLRQSSVLLLVGILPTVVAYLVDETRNRAWYKTVACFNLAGVLPYVFELYFMHGNQMSAVQKQLGNFNMWFVMYASAGAGWLTLWICPQIMQYVLRIFYVNRIEMHQQKIKKIEEEFSLE